MNRLKFGDCIKHRIEFDPEIENGENVEEPES